jgi:hypothetical protein
MEVPWTGVTKIMDTSPLSPHGFTICGLWFTTSRPTSFFAKRTLFRAYGRMIAPSCQVFYVGYRGKDLVSLNIVHWFHNILHLSDTSKCDNTTLEKFSVLDYLELSSQYVFPQEEPTATDFRIWKDAVRCLCSRTKMLPA